MSQGQEPPDAEVLAGPSPADVAEPAPGHCPQCGAGVRPADLFCEACGTPLPGGAAAGSEVPAAHPVPSDGRPAGPDGMPGAGPDADPGTPAAPAPCGRCGGVIAADGYCEQCGAPATRERDHWTEHPAPWVAGVCDRGIRHARNEDAMALAADAAGRFAALVVCDGVSTALDADVASLAAARAAREALVADGPVEGEMDARFEAWAGRFAVATEAANQAVTTATTEAAAANGGSSAPGNAPVGLPLSPPACTFVAAVLDGPVLVVGWVGDSRAYWLPDTGDPVQLSTDDSWASAAIEMGIPRELAERNPQAHAITRWLGPDSLDHAPRCSNLTLDSLGWVLVCSDGLWNYCSPAGELGALVADTVAAVGSDPEALAAELVAWANRQGGQDNITVALARVTPGSEDGGEGPAPQAGAEEDEQGTAPEAGAEEDEQSTAPEAGAGESTAPEAGAGESEQGTAPEPGA